MESNGTVIQNTEPTVSELQEQLLDMIDQEDNLMENKKTAASDFRRQIDTVRVDRKKIQKQLKALQEAQYIEEGTLIMEAGNDEEDELLRESEAEILMVD